MANLAPSKPATAFHELDIQAVVRAALQRIRNQTVSAALVLSFCAGPPSLNLVLRELQRLAKIGTLQEVGSRHGTRLFQRVKVDSVQAKESKKQKQGATFSPLPVTPITSDSSSTPTASKDRRIDAADVMGLGDLKKEAAVQQRLVGTDVTNMDDDDDFM